MVDYKKELVSHLEKILPTYYELYVDSNTAVPCITYLELNNTADKEGETLRYSNLYYRISIWGNDIAELSNYAVQLDSVMFPLGFTRTAYNELWNGINGRLVITYKAIGYEKY